MPLPSPKEIRDYVAANISGFHQTRLARLEDLKLKLILDRKNPYLFRAKNILTAEALVRVLLDAHLSSQEETLFGDFLEALAIHINAKAFGGKKSNAEGIDLEFDRDGIRCYQSSPAPIGATVARSTRCMTISRRRRALREPANPSWRYVQ